MAYQAYSAAGVANAILKDDYQNYMVSLLNTSHPLLEKLERSTVPFDGKAAVFPVTTAGVASVRSVGEGKAQPTAGQSVEAESRVLSRNITCRIELTDEVIKSSKGKMGAFVQAVEFQMKDATRATRDAANRQLNGNIINTDTTTGIMTQVNGVISNSTSGTVDNNRFLKRGMALRIGTAAEVADAGGGDNVIVASVSGTTSVTFVSAITAADNDLVVMGESGSASYGHEMSGLAHMVHDGLRDDGTTANQTTFQGITIADNPEWIAKVSRNGGTARPLSLSLMQGVIDQISNDCGADVDTILGHTSIRREYTALLQSDVRFVAKELKGGFSVISYTGGDREIPFFIDRFCTLGQIFFLTSDDVKQFVKEEWGWRDDDGKVLTKVQGYNKYEAQFVTQRNIGCLRRNSHGVLRDLQYTLVGGA